MEINIAICEDEQVHRSVLEHRIHTWFRSKSESFQCQLHSFSNAQGLLAQLETRNIFHDLFILDIGLSDTIDGFELARRLRQMHKMAEFIFISVNDRAYQQSVALRALDYQIKPPKDGDIEGTLDYIATRKALHSEEKITVHDRAPSSQGRKGAFPISSIAYLLRKKAPNYASNQVCVHGDLRFCINNTLAEFLKFNSTCFARPNNECVLNILYIEKVLAFDVLMRDDTLFEITFPFCNGFHEALYNFAAQYPHLAPEIQP